MPSTRPEQNDMDAGPFASATHALSPGTPSASLALLPRDRDMIIELLPPGSGSSRVLHLQNVRADTADAARAAIDAFFFADEDKATDVKSAFSYSEGFDATHDAVRLYAEERALKAGWKAEWRHGEYPRETLRRSWSQPRWESGIQGGKVRTVIGSRAVAGEVVA